MKVKLLHDCKVSLPAGTEIEVNEREAERLRAFGEAEIIRPAEKKKPTKKKG